MATYELKTESSFDGAHFLSDYYGKCENLHGHRWRVVAYLSVSKLETAGTERDMVVDFAVFKRALRQLTQEFDHMFLVEEGTLMQKTIDCLQEEGFEIRILPFRTTAENFARYFAGALRERGLLCSRVDVYETPLNCASYIPDPPEEEVVL